MDYFPFVALGFRCNPFRRLTDDESAAVAVLPDGLRQVAHSGAVHLQILGAQGRGKSTCIRALDTIFTRSGLRTAHEYLADGRNSFSTTLGGFDVFLLDEAQRLRARERTRLLVGASDDRRGFRLVLGVHDDMTRLFARHRLPLKTVCLGSVTPEYVQTMLTRRLAFFALDDSPAITFSMDAVRYLCDAFGGNLRLVERFLYEVFQSKPACDTLTSTMLARFKDLRPSAAGARW